MAKAKTVFFCIECGYESPKWMGQCPGCKAWNTFSEEPVEVKSKQSGSMFKKNEPVIKTINEVTFDEEERMHSGIGELDRVLGGGIVKGALILVGGDPGIGKSTLLLQMSRFTAKEGHEVIYISGEESLAQIKMRALRIGEFDSSLKLMSETDLDVIEGAILKLLPQIVIIDSIQTMFREDISSSPGSVSQVRETTSSLLRLAKQSGVTIFIVGHVTKEGTVAGPKMLEHMVDTVLYFEGDNTASYRILRAVKNRFGSTNEIGVFEMHKEGLAEVKNPSEYMLKGRPEGEPGSVVAVSCEGTRSLLVEIQALVCQTNFNLPRRTANGTDYNRVNMLMAVLEKRLGTKLSFCDAYINIAGGRRINEPALDLPIILSILSSYYNKEVPSKAAAFGEVGLTGEVRAVSQAEQRINEAAKLGYTMCIIPEVNKEAVKRDDIGIIGIRNVRELTKILN